MATLGNLSLLVSVNAQGAADGLKKTEAHVHSFASTVTHGFGEAAEHGVSVLEKGMTGLAGAAQSALGSIPFLGAGLAGLTGAAFGLAAQWGETIHRLHEQLELSENLGVSQQTLAAIQIKLGDGFEAAAKPLGIFSRNLGEARLGNDKAIQSFERLGLHVGDLKDNDEALDRTVRALSQIEDASLRAALARDVFGKGWMQMAPILRGGSEGLDQLRAKAMETGNVLDDQSRKNVESGNSFMKSVKAEWSGFTTFLDTQLLPDLMKADFWLMKGPDEGFNKFTKEGAGQKKGIGPEDLVQADALGRIDELIQKLKDEAAAVNKSAEATELYKLQKIRFTGAIAAEAQAKLADIEATLRQKDALKEAAKQAKEAEQESKRFDDALIHQAEKILGAMDSHGKFHAPAALEAGSAGAISALNRFAAGGQERNMGDLVKRLLTQEEKHNELLQKVIDELQKVGWQPATVNMI